MLQYSTCCISKPEVIECVGPCSGGGIKTPPALALKWVSQRPPHAYVCDLHRDRLRTTAPALAPNQVSQQFHIEFVSDPFYDGLGSGDGIVPPTPSHHWASQRPSFECVSDPKHNRPNSGRGSASLSSIHIHNRPSSGRGSASLSSIHIHNRPSSGRGSASQAPIHNRPSSGSGRGLASLAPTPNWASLRPPIECVSGPLQNWSGRSEGTAPPAPAPNLVSRRPPSVCVSYPIRNCPSSGDGIGQPALAQNEGISSGDPASGPIQVSQQPSYDSSSNRSSCNAENANGIRAMLINACSVKNKSCILKDTIVDNSLQLLFITETWLSPYDTSAIAAFIPESHNFYHFPRDNRPGGGIGVAASKSIQSVKSVNRIFGSFECLQINIAQENNKICFYLIYRPPSSSVASFFDEFENFITEAEMAHDRVFYLGDFNIWMNKTDDANTVKMSDILSMHDLKNFVDNSTHKSGNTLDLIITKYDSLMISDIYLEPTNTISDLKYILFNLNIKGYSKRYKKITFRNTSNLNEKDFTEHLSAGYENYKNNATCSHSVSNAVKCASCISNFYKDCTSSYINTHAPLIEKKISVFNDTQNKWYNNDIRKAKCDLRKAERKLYRRNTDENRIEFIRLRQIKCSLVDEIKKKYYQNEIRMCNDNYKELYRVLNELIGKNSTVSHLPSFHNSEELPEKFKEFFIQKISDISNLLISNKWRCYDIHTARNE